VIGNAQAIDEVTVVQVDRGHIEMLVQRNPLLLQECRSHHRGATGPCPQALTATAD